MFRFRTFIALLLVLSLTFLFAACKDGDADEKDVSEESKISEKEDVSETEKEDVSVTEKEDVSKAEEAAEGNYTFDHITLELPEGFTMSELNGVPVALCPGYPTPSDNITFTQTAADNINAYSKDVFENTYKQMFEGFDEITSYELIKVDGVDSIRLEYGISANGIAMVQTQVFIFGKSFTDIITFTDVSGNFDDAFEDCLASVKVK